MKYFSTLTKSILAIAISATCVINAQAAKINCTFNPANGDRLSEIEYIQLGFTSSASIVDVSLFSLTDGNGKACDFTAEASSFGLEPSIIVVPTRKITTPGTYTLSVKPGAISVAAGTNDNEITASWIVVVPSAYTGTYTIDPAPGKSYEKIKNFTFTFPAESKVKVSETATSKTFPKLLDSDGNRVKDGSAVAEDNVLEVLLYSEMDEPGDYTLLVPRDLITIDGQKFGEDLRLSYTVANDKKTFSYTYTLSPADGSNIEANQTFTVTFAAEGLSKIQLNMFASSIDGSLPYIKDPKGTGLTCRITEGADGFSFSLTPYYPLEDNGKYTLVIPAKYVKLINNDGDEVNNKAFTASYQFGEEQVTPDDPVEPDEPDDPEDPRDLPADEPTGPRTVLLDEDFNGDYTKSFPYLLDHDQLTPHSSIASLFYSSQSQAYMPWWILADESGATDKYMGSHSYYTPAGISDDWLISVPVTIPTTGFVLSFDAQSWVTRGLDKLSNLYLYITEALVDPASLPDTPTKVWRKIPVGDDLEQCAGDFTHYRYSLDDWAGKTIYINFVNQNVNKDLLLLDNVKISRPDIAVLTLDACEPYTTETEVGVGVVAECFDAAGLKDWTLVLTVNGEQTQQWSGDLMAKGEKVEAAAKVPVEKSKTTVYEFTLTADGGYPVVARGEVTGMSFVPTHRVFIEESTSTSCGYCPAGAYTIDGLINDPDLKDLVVPVSVHISAMGPDPMTNVDYDAAFGVTSAPMIFADRDETAISLNFPEDLEYDSEKEGTVAHKIRTLAETPTFIDLQVEGQWAIEGADTTAINCKAIVKSAINLSNANYRIAFILTENNVWKNTRRESNWGQLNYFSGAEIDTDLGGWTKVGNPAYRLRFHDVARKISRFRGHENSLPTSLKLDQEYSFEYKMPIPTTTPAIQRQFCVLNAIVIDYNTGRVVNAARMPMSDVADQRFSLEQYLQTSSNIDIVDVDYDDDDDNEAIYNLQGIRISNPRSGEIYLQGGALRMKR